MSARQDFENADGRPPAQRPPITPAASDTACAELIRAERLRRAVCRQLDRTLDAWQAAQPGLSLLMPLQIFLGTDDGRQFARLMGIGADGPGSFRFECFAWREAQRPGEPPRLRQAIRLGEASPWFVFDERTEWGSRVSPGRFRNGRVLALPSGLRD